MKERKIPTLKIGKIGRRQKLERFVEQNRDIFEKIARKLDKEN